MINTRGRGAKGLETKFFQPGKFRGGAVDGIRGKKRIPWKKPFMWVWETRIPVAVNNPLEKETKESGPSSQWSGISGERAVGGI